jgi:GTP-binding protein YchF
MNMVNMKCGIVGLPNVGKSTLFNALTETISAQAENFPFCTIEPNVGTVCVPEPRLSILKKRANAQKVIPTQLTFVDIAGLVKGASQGHGLGNQFLSNIRNVDIILQVLRCFHDDNVTHVEGSVHPLRDVEIIETELMLADLQSIEKRMNKKKKDDLHPLLLKAKAALDQGLFASSASWTDDDKALWSRLDLLTLKPIVYVCNVNEDTPDNTLVQSVQQYAEQKQTCAIAVCNTFESEIAQIAPEERKDLIDDQHMSGLATVIRSVYNVLGLHTFFTAGPKEVRAWPLAKGHTAFDAAGVIHTDFQKGFIRAETIHYTDYIHSLSDQDLKETGKIHLKGKDYVVQDGDVMHFRFNL